MTSPKAPAGGIVRTSLDNTWRTPESILDRARAYFGGPIPFDPATGPENPAKALRFCAGAPGTLFAQDLAPDDFARRNGLEVDWPAPAWVNPPYGKELRDWLLKIEREAARGTEILALLPCARWEQGYFTRALGAARAVCFHRGRVAFVSSIDGAAVGGNPYASMILGVNVCQGRFARAFEPIGACFSIRPTDAAVEPAGERA
jgi:hypothetical protein